MRFELLSNSCVKNCDSVPCRFVRRGHDCVIVTRTSRHQICKTLTQYCIRPFIRRQHFAVPARLQAHPNSQRPPVIDCDVLHSLNTSGALVLDSDPNARILALAQRCSSRERSAVVISKNDIFSRSSGNPLQFRVLSFHISGSSFSLLPKISANVADSIDSILKPNQIDVRSALKTPRIWKLNPSSPFSLHVCSNVATC